MEAAGSAVSARRRRFAALPIDAALWAAAALALAALAGAGVAWNREATFDVLIGIAAIAVVLRRPFAVLLVVLLAMPKGSPFVQLSMLVGGFGAFVLRGRRPAALPLAVPFALFLLVTVWGVAWHDAPGFNGVGQLETPFVHLNFIGRPSGAGFEWLRLAFALAMALLAATTVDTTRKLELMVAAVLVSAAYPLYRGVDQLIAGDLVARGGFNAVRGPFAFPNEYGSYLAVVLTLMMVALFEVRDLRLRIALAAESLVALLMLYHTFTRAAWLGFAAIVLLLAVLRYRRLFLVGALVMLLAAVAVPSVVGSVQERFGDLGSKGASQSKNSWTWRRGEWRRMGHFGSARPLFGQGLGSYHRLTVQEFGLEDGSYQTVTDPTLSGKKQLGFAAHNDYVKMWVETGAVGLLLWVFVLAGLIGCSAYVARTPETAPWGVALLAIAIALVGISVADNVQTDVVTLAYPIVLTAGAAAAARAARGNRALRAPQR